MLAVHSCRRSRLHLHHTRRLDPAPTATGRSFPLRSSCHSRARVGYFAARVLALVARRPEQNGQPAPCSPRALTAVAHSCFFEHLHHTRLCEPSVTSLGVSVPFLPRSHSATSHGATLATLLLRQTLRPEQKGQPLPRTKRA